MGAIHPYLPERKAPQQKLKRHIPKLEVWRASSLRSWQGDNMTFPFDRSTNDKAVVEPDDPGAPPFQGHRWLLLRESTNSLMRTPIYETEFDA